MGRGTRFRIAAIALALLLSIAGTISNGAPPARVADMQKIDSTGLRISYSKELCLQYQSSIFNRSMRSNSRLLWVTSVQLPPKADAAIKMS